MIHIVSLLFVLNESDASTAMSLQITATNSDSQCTGHLHYLLYETARHSEDEYFRLIISKCKFINAKGEKTSIESPHRSQYSATLQRISEEIIFISTWIPVYRDHVYGALFLGSKRSREREKRNQTRMIHPSGCLSSIDILIRALFSVSRLRYFRLIWCINTHPGDIQVHFISTNMDKFFLCGVLVSRLAFSLRWSNRCYLSVVQLLAVLLTAQAGPRRKPSSGGRPGKGNGNQWATKICANLTVAQSFLTQTRQVIGTLQSNSSFAGALQKQANQIAYIQNSANGELLASNCTGFFTGLASARQLDRQANTQQRQYERTVRRLLMNIVRSVTGTRKTNKSY